MKKQRELEHSSSFCVLIEKGYPSIGVGYPLIAAHYPPIEVRYPPIGACYPPIATTLSQIEKPVIIKDRNLKWSGH